LLAGSSIATAWSDSTLGNAATILLQGAAMMYALLTSRAPRAVVWLAGFLFVVGIVVTLVVAAVDAGDSTTLLVWSAVRAGLTVIALVAIVRRLAAHPFVSGETLMGALCVYLLLGLLFAASYGLLEAVNGAPFFAQTASSSWIDRLYFSFATLTTAGYGDLTASSDVGRVVAVGEAVLGQLYLVSVVAVVVGNLGRSRHADPG
jgi:Ion channel